MFGWNICVLPTELIYFTYGSEVGDYNALAYLSYYRYYYYYYWWYYYYYSSFHWTSFYLSTGFTIGDDQLYSYVTVSMTRRMSLDKDSYDH